MRQRVAKHKLSNLIGIFRPVASAHHTTAPPATTRRLAEHEHTELTPLNDDEDIIPLVVFRLLANRLPCLSFAQDTFFGPGRAKQCKLLIRYRNRGRIRVVRRDTLRIVLVRLFDDCMREVGRKPRGSKQS